MIHEKTLNIRLADWQLDREHLSQVRRKVFIEEQKVPEDMEWDEDDETATHFLVTLQGKPIATARLTAKGQIGRMAVLEGFRRQGIGEKLLIFVLKNAENKNFKNLFLHAQVSAIPFYEKQGFVVDGLTAHGEVFYEAGIAHQKMCLNLNIQKPG